MIDIPVRVKDALKSGMYLKNYRVIVLDSDGNEEGTIDNNRLVSESVKLDERMCSGNNLKFGLCEGSSLEFQYFDYDNINGKRVKLMLDVQYLDEEGALDWYEIPMGYFDVDSCPMQFSTGIRKATCYNKLKSKYLDQKANELIIAGYDNKNITVTIYDLRSNLLDDFEIEAKELTEVEIERVKFAIGTQRKLGTTAISFRSKYGIDSPLNYFEYCHANTNAPMNAYPFVLAQESKATLSIDKAYKIKSEYDIEELEQYYYDKISDLVALSFNTTSEEFKKRLNTPSTSTGSGYDSYDGWHQYFGIGLEKAMVKLNGILQLPKIMGVQKLSELSVIC